MDRQKISKLLSGTIWVKITQGDLSKSALQKVQLINDETITLDLSQWETGEIAVWLVVENGESGLIRVEQDFYAELCIDPLLLPHHREIMAEPRRIRSLPFAELCLESDLR